MWNEWHGRGIFANAPNYPGGISGLNMDKKKSWRKHFDTAEAKHYSRLLYIIEQVKATIRTQSIDEAAALDWFEDLYTSHNSISGLVKYLKSLEKEKNKNN